MKAILATAAAATVIAMAAPAAAQVDASIGYSLTDAGDANLGAVTGRVGMRAGWLGAEGELSLGVGSDDVGAAKVKLDNQWAVYGKAIAPVAENFDVFARVGYGESRIETKLARVPAPTLVVRGGWDTTVPQRWAEQVTALLPHGRLAVIPRAPHTLNYNAPRQVAQLVRAFLDESQSPSKT